jgi:uncharacterized protein YfaP (DUF2135 family)
MSSTQSQDDLPELERLQITLQRLKEANANEIHKGENIDYEMQVIEARREDRAHMDEARDAKLHDCLAHCARIKNLQDILHLPVDEDIEDGLFELDEQRLMVREQGLRTQHFDLREKWINHEMSMKQLRTAEDRTEALRNEAVARRKANRQREKILRQMREEEAVFRAIDRAKNVSDLERINLSEIGDEVSVEIQSLLARRIGMFRDHEHAIERAKRFRVLMEALSDANTLKEIDAVSSDDLAEEHIRVLEELRERRRVQIEAKEQRDYERQRHDEAQDEILSARTTAEIDTIEYEGVNEKVAWDLRKLAAVRRQELKAGEVSSQILGCNQVPVLDEVRIEGVSQDAALRLRIIQTERRDELVAQLRETSQLERFNDYRIMIVECEDLEEIVTYEFYNVGESQHSHLEDLRKRQLDELEEAERLRIIAEQLARFEEILTEIQAAENSADVAAIEIDGVDENQAEELVEMQNSVYAILLENENVSSHVAVSLETEVASSVDIDTKSELAFRQRLQDNKGVEGDIQFTLMWEDRNDLDLVVTTPTGNIIHRGQRESPNGIYDIEMNFEPESEEAIENIVWPNDAGQEGEYHIFVWFRARHGRFLSSRSTPFQLRIRNGYDIQLVEGDLALDDELFHAALINTVIPALRAQAEEDAETALKNAINAVSKIMSVDQLPTAADFQMRILDRDLLSAAIEERRQHIEDAALAAKRRAEEERFREQRSLLEVMPLGDLRETTFDGVSRDQMMELDDLRSRRIAILERALQRQREEQEKAALEARLAVLDEILETADVDALHALDLSELPAAEGRSREKARLNRIRELESAEADRIATAATLAEMREVLEAAYSRTGLELSIENHRREFEKRKDIHNCANGAVTISLIWDDKNDLNLLVQGPNGDIIHPRHRSSNDGGVMDVDMNTRPQSNKPIEHIRWDIAAFGTYKVFVHHFACHRRLRSKDPSDFCILIGANGKSDQYAGSLHPGDPVQFVSEFTVTEHHAPADEEE